MSFDAGSEFLPHPILSDLSKRPFIAEECERNIPLPTQRTQRPTAEQLANGIVRAGRQGLITAWKHGSRYVESEEQTDGSWLTPCLAHDDHNPSLVISDRVDERGNSKLLVFCRAGCKQDKVIEALDDLGLWNCTPEKIEELNAASGSNKTSAVTRRETRDRGVAIIPIPPDAPEPPNAHPYLGPPSRRWTYREANGAAVCHVYRFDPNSIWLDAFKRSGGKLDDPARKAIRPLTFCEYQDGSKRYDWRAPAGNIPLYNSDKLALKPTAKVKFCEGEKAADAGQVVFPDCVVVTSFGGASRISQTSFVPLKDRDLTIWPDNDKAGAEAAQSVINALQDAGCKRISIVDARALAAINPKDPDGAKREPPDKWDAANAFSEWTDHARLRQEVDRHTRLLGERVCMQISPDNIGETVDKAEDVLKNSLVPIFKRGDLITRVCHSREKCPDGRTQSVLVAQTLNAAGMGEALESVIAFQQRHGEGKYKPAHASDLLVKTFLERGKRSGLNALTGLTDIPLARRDGSLLDSPGYDEATGLYYWPSGLSLKIPVRPTQKDAQDAVAVLKNLFRDFPFQTEVDEAAAISALLTAVTRPTLGASPMHVFTAPTPGSGKSLLANVITIVATGNQASFITQGPTDEELEKRLSSQMLEGRQVINLDNCNRPIKGAALCNLLTAERVSLRILGQSKTPDITSTSCILVNGNNVRLSDDMVRRAVISYIDPGVERPEEREIGWDIIAEARNNRGMYVSACMTIMLAYQAARAPKQATSLGSFEDWSRRVRDALIWAGLPDPCGNAGKLRDGDPEKERFVAIAEQWNTRFGDGWKKVSEVISEANQSPDEFRVALMNVADAGREINANRLGSYLGRFKGRPIDGFKFVSRKGHAGILLWRLEKLGSATSGEHAAP